MTHIEHLHFRAFLPIFVALSLAIAPGMGTAQAVRDGPVEARLVAENLSIQPGKPFTVALLLSVDPDWHVYWKNPGDSGLPTTFELALPPGFSAGPLQWPVPERFVSHDLVTYGYSRRVLLLTEVLPPRQLPTGVPLTLRARAAWLACRVECTPGKASLALSLPVLPGTPLSDTRWASALRETRDLLPSRQGPTELSATLDAGQVTLVRNGAPPPEGTQVMFYPGSAGQLSVSSPQKVSVDASSLRLRLQREPGSRPLKSLVGLLVTMGNGISRAVEVDVPVSPARGSAVEFIVTLLLAFLGGMILNLMPCVLPVISLKVISFVRHGEEQGRGSARQGLLFSLGVLVSFWIVAGVLVGLRAGGRLLGWGFQFQDPVVIVITALLFFLIGLNLFGVFEVGTSLTRLGGKVRGKAGAGSFLSGVFATAVATPCTAPFMGAAVGFALSRSVGASFGVFSALALGMAAPFLLLSALPGLVTRLPKPGPWMETLRQVMAFPMMAAAIWMASVLAAFAGSSGVIILLGAMLTASLGAWIWGRWGVLARPVGIRAAAGVLAVLLVAGGTAGALTLLPRDSAAPERVSAEPAAVSWEPWSAERVDRLRRQGAPVFLDFTARWCLSCQVNEKVALGNSAVRKRFKEAGVATLRADWTDSNDAIARALAGFGRASVPLYVYYPPGGKDPVILPELLTPGIVLAALR